MSNRVVSLFAGAGGLSSGFVREGLRLSLAAEIDGDAVATYRANVSDAVIRCDIGLEAERIARKVGPESPFAVIGGPPCQGFSTAGARDRGDSRNRLVFAYIGIVSRLRPSWFLFENVEGILTSGGGDAILGLSESFAELGYSFRVDKVNFAQWGLPQARKRVLIVGNRHGIDFSLPPPTHTYDGKKHRGGEGVGTSTSGDAIAGLPPTPARSHRDRVDYISDLPATAYDASMRTKAPGPRGHAVAGFERDVERIRMLKPGQSLRDLPEHMWPDSFRSRAFRRVADGVPTERRGGAPAGIRRLDSGHASLTITSFSPRELVHPGLDRPLSLRECARLQSFPDGHDFQGGFQSVATQIGNAFPPLAAAVLARWMQSAQGIAGADMGGMGASVPSGLIGYTLTEASGMSPALQATDARLRSIVRNKGTTVMRPPKRPRIDQDEILGSKDHVQLGPEDRKTVADGRVLGPISMSDREIGRLLSVVLRDLGHDRLIPQWARDIPSGDYYTVPLAWFVRDEERPFEIGRFFLECCAAIKNFRVIFRCITKLHRHRRKYEVILRTQPLPTMEQVARRGLLEYGGGLPVDALASWLTWRKWVYDIDNRSAQETGYLFEPILSESLGGRSVSAKASPVKRADDPAKGRQVDCIVEFGGRRLAYEFKDRITIAASGQGRFAEELAFPRDCASSGHVPVLLVMDPTPNLKLTAITKAFRENGGEVFLGDEVWTHLSRVSGPEIATFVKRYIKDPVESIAVREKELLDLSMSYKSGSDGDTIQVKIGEHSWIVQRPRRDDAVALAEEEGEG